LITVVKREHISWAYLLSQFSFDTTDAQSNIPPYMDVIYAKWNDPAGTITIGDEEANEAGAAESFTSYSYVYDGDGARAIEVISTTQLITTVFIGNYFEYTISNTQAITKSYYYAGGTRVAMRDGGELYFLLSDHLGSTSLTVEDDETMVFAEQRYSPWGSAVYCGDHAYGFHLHRAEE
jgi:hypothetical protein